MNCQVTLWREKGRKQIRPYYCIWVWNQCKNNHIYTHTYSAKGCDQWSFDKCALKTWWQKCRKMWLYQLSSISTLLYRPWKIKHFFLILFMEMETGMHLFLHVFSFNHKKTLQQICRERMSFFLESPKCPSGKKRNKAFFSFVSVEKALIGLCTMSNPKIQNTVILTITYLNCNERK